MDLNQQNILDFRVLRGQNNQWHVTGEGLPQPLASFDSPHAACEWAIARAKPQQGRVFVEETFVDYARSSSSCSHDRLFTERRARSAGNHLYAFDSVR